MEPRLNTNATFRENLRNFELPFKLTQNSASGSLDVSNELSRGQGSQEGPPSSSSDFEEDNNILFAPSQEIYVRALAERRSGLPRNSPGRRNVNIRLNQKKKELERQYTKTVRKRRRLNELPPPSIDGPKGLKLELVHEQLPIGESDQGL